MGREQQSYQITKFTKWGTEKNEGEGPEEIEQRELALRNEFADANYARRKYGKVLRLRLGDPVEKQTRGLASAQDDGAF